MDMKLRTTTQLEKIANWQIDWWEVRKYNEAVRELQRRYRMRTLNKTQFPKL